jgi:hypothetical protein
MEKPVPVKREYLLVLWTVRPAKNQKTDEILTDVWQVRGRVYYKTDPIMEKPRLLCEVLLPKDIVKDNTMEQLIAAAEERVQLDLDEIAATGPFSDAPVHEDGIDDLRRCMAR